MTIRSYVRVIGETRSDGIVDAMSATLYDAAWMLARQWQLGELQADDAGSPIVVRHTADIVSVTAFSAGTEAFVPSGLAPIEAELEPGPWATGLATEDWSAALRVTVGRELAALFAAAGHGDQIPALTDAFPFSRADTGLAGVVGGRFPDGAAVYGAWAGPLEETPPRVPPTAGISFDDALVGAAVEWLEFCRQLGVVAATDAWDKGRFVHTGTWRAPAPHTSLHLVAAGHRGGPMDWWSFDVAEEPGDEAAAVEHRDAPSLPTRVTFKGMPSARFWELEDAAIDLGNVDAHPADLARLALLEFMFDCGNDVFATPVQLPIGSLCRTTNLLVTDTFGLTTRIGPASSTALQPGQSPLSRWAMFTLSGQETGAPWFHLPANTVGAVVSEVVEEVLLARDEMANIVWAVETTVEGHDGRPRSRAGERDVPPALTSPPTNLANVSWSFGTVPPSNWYPMALDVDPEFLTVRSVAQDDDALGPYGHFVRIGDRIAFGEVPREGRRLKRDYVLARAHDGSTVVWSRRMSGVGRGESTAGLDFDAVRPSASPS